MDKLLRVGIDIGSTTIKMVVINNLNEVVYKTYRRHLSDIKNAFVKCLEEGINYIGENSKISMVITGSGGMSLAEELSVDFTQEVIASTKAIQMYNESTDVVIELGGEDAKIIYLNGGIEQRMNGTCAGGTGAFIDQMSGLLNTDATGLNKLAKGYKNIYPIAARCGVFAKTDIQPLINEGAKREDIAMSIFHAVVVQTISVLACGRPIKGKVAFLGGPLTFLSELRSRFIEVLKLKKEEVVFPNDSELYISLGAALSCNDLKTTTIYEVLYNLKNINNIENNNKTILRPLFKNEKEYGEFIERHNKNKIKRKPIENSKGNCFLGIDAGSTTTKAVVINENGEILYSHYTNNDGSPLKSTIGIIRDIYTKMPKNLKIANSAVTGYGEAMLKEAFGIDIGEVETIAHYKGAKFFNSNVDFILDIGGQDMKCLKIKDGCIKSITLNEACSAGCGSFLQAFAKSLKIDLEEFARKGLLAKNPVDLGSKCTVFMNSKVKQAQKEGFGVDDISAGLAYSVVKNTLYKVIKLRNPEELGHNIVVQGGTFYNEAVLRSFEILSQRNVVRPDISGLMGAFGVSLIALERYEENISTTLITLEELDNIKIKNSTSICGKCSNNCMITINDFGNNKKFIAGNRCDEALGIKNDKKNIPNIYEYKYKRVFNYKPLNNDMAYRGVVGIPRVLNIYENYPFWFTFFDNLGFRVILSDKSSKKIYEKGLESIASETVCYPAKMVHGHIENLVEKGVKNIFYPCIIHEVKEQEHAKNSFNCPVVTSYPEVIKNNIESLRENNISFMNPFLPFRNKSRLKKRLEEELKSFNITKKEIILSVDKAFEEQEKFKNDIRKKGEETLKYIEENNIRGILLGGRPYHIDPEINHGIPKLVNSLDMAVFTEDSLAHLGKLNDPLRVVDQWAYHSRLYASSNFIVNRGDIDLVQLTSFGCGIDAITTEQVQEILDKESKIYTNIKIDEGSNLGAARIRLRSLKAVIEDRIRNNFKEEIKENYRSLNQNESKNNLRTTIIAPQFSPIHFDILVHIFNINGFNLEILQNYEDIVEEGLKYVNNDTCYPAIVVIGQIIKALKSNKFDIKNTKILLAQTEGQCRFTNYTSVLEKALKDSGFENIPIVSLSLAGAEKEQGLNGLNITLMKKLILGVIYGDLLTKVLYRVRPYEKIEGSANKLYEKWADTCKKSFESQNKKEFEKNIKGIIEEFEGLPRLDVNKPKVGIVGELLVKLHPVANNNIIDILEKEGVEVVANDLLTLFLSTSYDNIYNYRYLDGKLVNKLIGQVTIKFIEKYQSVYIRALKNSKLFNAPEKIKDIASNASKIISLGNQSGEGWKLPGEIIELIQWDVKNIICMQPFGCLPSHSIARGAIKEIKRIYNDFNIVPIEYDPGASEVNQLNRIKLMLSKAFNKI